MSSGTAACALGRGWAQGSRDLLSLSLFFPVSLLKGWSSVTPSKLGAPAATHTNSEREHRLHFPKGKFVLIVQFLYWILKILLLSKQLSRRLKKTLAYFARIHILSVLLWSPCVVHYDENHFYTSVWMEINAPTQSKFSGHLTGSKLTGML